MLQVLVGVYMAVMGLLIGSFLNVCICRLPQGRTVVRGRSMCMSCGHVIPWHDNIPLVSFVALRGKCRFCGARISPRYPLVEGLNAAVYLAAYLSMGLSARMGLTCLSASALIVAAFLDLDTRMVPDRISVFIAALGIVGLLVGREPPLWQAVLGALVISAPMLILALALGGFGGADIKLSAACGLLLGLWQMLLAGLIAALSAAALAGIGLASGKLSRKGAIPFVPALAAGVIVSGLFGPQIIAWYLGLFGL
ncbi:MAG: prepilin peptidase [Christensenellales bacterium]